MRDLNDLDRLAIRLRDNPADCDSWAELVKRLDALCRKIAFQLSRHLHSIEFEDALQYCFLSIRDLAGSYDEAKSSFLTHCINWLYLKTKRDCIDANCMIRIPINSRTETAFIEIVFDAPVHGEEDSVLDQIAGPVDIEASIIDRDLLRHIAQNAPPGFLECMAEERHFTDMAKELNCPPDSLRKKYAAASKAIRAEFG